MIIRQSVHEVCGQISSQSAEGNALRDEEIQEITRNETGEQALDKSRSLRDWWNFRVTWSRFYAEISQSLQRQRSSEGQG